MATEEQLREGLQEMAKRFGPAVSNIAIVKSVDEENATCVLIDEDDQEFLDVRLRPVLTGKQSFLQVPKVGSFVLAIRIEDDDDWLVIAQDETEKFLWITPTAKIEVSEKILIEANEKNLLSLMERLFTVLEKGYQTNNGPTINLILTPEFESIKNDFKQLLK
ncbi:hypothetical protein [Epilithonimonas xixisoli]|uniref:Uncharacterized protein n=1 Tax=Epilithonimonas xixisoli TaxID=1476462 RepID=A0A4R8IH56_9FLAO|nr:hypothetical protein [Epilithonimonas xixisoli]TDX86173.1 hypothetical protein B0I22_0283 [Epilithonimonas xixisoli]